MAQNAYGAQFIVNNILPVKPLIFSTFFLCDLLQLLVDVEELEIWNTHMFKFKTQNYFSTFVEINKKPHTNRNIQAHLQFNKN